MVTVDPVARTINGVRIVTADTPASNGVVHTIDELLRRPDSRTDHDDHRQRPSPSTTFRADRDNRSARRARCRSLSVLPTSPRVSCSPRSTVRRWRPPVSMSATSSVSAHREAYYGAIEGGEVDSSPSTPARCCRSFIAPEQPDRGQRRRAARRSRRGLPEESRGAHAVDRRGQGHDRLHPGRRRRVQPDRLVEPVREQRRDHPRRPARVRDAHAIRSRGLLRRSTTPSSPSSCRWRPATSPPPSRTERSTAATSSRPTRRSTPVASSLSRTTWRSFPTKQCSLSSVASSSHPSSPQRSTRSNAALDTETLTSLRGPGRQRPARRRRRRRRVPRHSAE